MIKKILIILLIVVISILITLQITDHFSDKQNNYNMIICGCARNVEKYLPDALNKIEELCKICDKYFIIIYENDSTDNTLEILNKFNKKYKNNCKIISENNLDKRFPKRTHRLSYARNKILDYINKNNMYNEYNYYVNIDLDNVNKQLNINAVKKLLTSNLDWHVGTANQKNIYYDLWALRTHKYNKNMWSYDEHNKGVDFNLTSRLGVNNIDVNSKPIRVLSAFGGFAIYKINKIKNCSYDGYYDDPKVDDKKSGDETPDFDEECEHVKFHKDIREKNNGKIYIIPYLTNNGHYN